MNIQPITQIRRVEALSKTHAQPPAKNGQGGFSDALAGAVGNASPTHQGPQGGSAIEGLLAGRPGAIHPIASSVAGGDMSFHLLMGVRSKVVEAYRQTKTPRE